MSDKTAPFGGLGPALIRLAYRQVIDAASPGDFARDVFNDTYNEFLIQIQTYNQDNQFSTWQQLRTAIPKSDVTLQYKVGFAIGLYVRALGSKTPGLWDTLGRVNLPFDEHRFGLLDSDITNKSAHRVALTYLTDPLTLLGTVGNYLVLALDEPAETTEPLETFLVEIRPNLSICSYLR